MHPPTSQKRFFSQKKVKFWKLQVRWNFQVVRGIFLESRLAVRIPPVNFKNFPRVIWQIHPVCQKSKEMLELREGYRRQKNPLKDRKTQNLGI